MKLLIALLVLINFITSTLAYQLAYAVWNSKPNVANIGIVNLDTAALNSTITYTNSKHAGLQTATYNAKTNQIISLLESNEITTLYTANIEDWSQDSKTLEFPYNYNVSSVASDQTTGDYNLFITYTESSDADKDDVKNSFVVAKVSINLANYVTSDTLSGTFLVSSYNYANEVFLVAFTNFSGTYVNQYSQNGNLIKSELFTLGNVPNSYSQSSNLYNMIFVPRDGSTILNIDLESSTSPSAPDVFLVNTATNQFTDLGYLGGKYMREGTSGVWALTTNPTKPIVYSISKTPLLDQYPTGISLDQIDTSNKNKVTSFQFPVPLYRMWAF